MSKSPASALPVRVLVVEDNADDRELLLYQLQKAGMADHVKFISDGREALNFLTVDDPQIVADELVAVFLDLKLPSLSGLELLRRLRKDGLFQTTPVIVMTSSNDPRDLEECRRLHVTNYVSKPVTLTSFSKAVADIFHLPRASSQPARKS
jgi:CheY-like chemotaxis protein